MSHILFAPLSSFAAEVSDKLKLPGTGAPEEQLRAPLERFIEAAGKVLGTRVICQGEFHIKDIGRPDYAVFCDGAACGFIEIKQPGKGANPGRYRGHDKKQWECFRELPNILYTDGNEWALYQNGERTGDIIRLNGDIASDGKKAICPADADALERLIRVFLTWDPIPPKDAKSLARLIAPLCRMLRDEVAGFLEDSNSSFCLLHSEWQTTLFPDQSQERFADAYAQTVTFSLLLANAEGGNVLDLRDAESALASGHLLLARALKIFTDNLNPREAPVSLAVLQRIVAAIPKAGFNAKDKDPWLYFYEDFLTEYDPKLRKDSGTYYTPVEVVQAMTRLTGNILERRMGKTHGFAAPDVMTLDPAVGSGAFLLSVIAETLAPISDTMGAGAATSFADALARQLYGFEQQVGPYAVAQLRLTRALGEYGARLPADGPNVYLTDTLESPDIVPQFPSLLSRALSEQHKKAIAIKKHTPILVCIGNPPYDRHEAADGKNRKETGGWVRWGDEDENGEYRPQSSLMDSFVSPAREAGLGVHLKNLYNLYVYFWRWALWKVFEQKEDSQGIVSFVTASSFLEGPAFAGMREALRRLCHEVWIIDLGGEGRGSRKEENIFNIQTPVCITLATRYGAKDRDTAAEARYARVSGSRPAKLACLESIVDFDSLRWHDCPTAWQANLTPAGKGDYFSFPLLSDIFPWQQSGAKLGRTWPIASDRETLRGRWSALLSSPDRAVCFKETRDRKIANRYRDFEGAELEAIARLPNNVESPEIAPYGYRSFDRQFCICDNRLGDCISVTLWQTYGEKQIYFATKFAQAVGVGPALTLSSEIPDLHYFCNRGAKDILPLYRDAEATEPNIIPGLLELLEQSCAKPVSAEDLAAYVYALLAHNAFAEKFRDQLASREIRVPMTRDAELFNRAATIGKRLIWLHSYGERLMPDGQPKGFIPPGEAKCSKAVPLDSDGYPESFYYNENTKTLHVGTGEFGPVSPDVYFFEVSGLKVTQSWLKYRMKEGSGRKSSPLDDIRPRRWTAEYTEDLLRLLWILEATLAEYPAQRVLLEEILAGELISADELPPVPGEARKAPSAKKKVSARQNSLLP